MGLDVVLVGRDDVEDCEDRPFLGMMGYLRKHYPAAAALQFGELPGALAEGCRVGSYGSLHVLRGLAVLHQQGAALEGVDEEALSKAAEQFYEGNDAATARYKHLLNHSDCEGYYVPVDMPEPFCITWTPAPDDEDYDEPETMSVGSSQGLLQELDALAPLLGLEKDLLDVGGEDAFEGSINTHRWPTAAWVWGVLRAFARASVENGLVVVFC